MGAKESNSALITQHSRTAKIALFICTRTVASASAKCARRRAREVNGCPSARVLRHGLHTVGTRLAPFAGKSRSHHTTAFARRDLRAEAVSSKAASFEQSPMSQRSAPTRKCDTALKVKTCQACLCSGADASGPHLACWSQMGGVAAARHRTHAVRGEALVYSARSATGPGDGALGTDDCRRQ